MDDLQELQGRNLGSMRSLQGWTTIQMTVKSRPWFVRAEHILPFYMERLCALDVGPI
jgi:hypothetical protein